MLPLKPPYNILHFINIYFLHKIFVPSETGDISTSTPHFFCTSKFDFFDLRNPKNSNCHIPSSRHHGQDSVDRTFSMKMLVNCVHIWSVDVVQFQDDAAGAILFKVPDFGILIGDG